MQKPSSTLLLQLLALLGLGAISLSIYIYFLSFDFRVRLRSRVTPVRQEVTKQATSQSSVRSGSDEVLGELGSRCGGRERLPCRPGLRCSAASSVSLDEGVCVKADVATSTKPASVFGVSGSVLGQLGDGCGPPDHTLCAPGLYCHLASEGLNRCTKIDANAPHVLSIKIDGAQPAQGIYRLPPEKSVRVVAQTVNVSTVTMSLDVKDAWAGSSLLLGDVHRDGGGKYSAPLHLPKGVEGVVNVTVTSKAGDTAYVSIGVASSE